MAGADEVTDVSAVGGPTAIILICFKTVTAYNFLELNIMIFTTLKRRNGLYFWSFIIATWGTLVHAIGFTLKQFQLITHSILYGTICLVGWYAMVTGQSLVLYSRLNLVLLNQTWLRAVLIMIIVDAIVCHAPITVLHYGFFSDNPQPFLSVFAIYEKVEVTIFYLQELVISALYIQATARFLRNAAMVRANMCCRNTGYDTIGQNVMKHLLYVTILVVLIDIPILALEYANLNDLQTGYKAFAYGLKLKLEFSILNRLLEAAKPQPSPAIDWNSNTDTRTTGHGVNSVSKSQTTGRSEDFELRHHNTNTSQLWIMEGQSAVVGERQLRTDAESERTQESAVSRADYGSRALERPHRWPN